MAVLLAVWLAAAWATAGRRRPRAGKGRRILGRETPRGSLLGFMRAARENNDAVAAQFDADGRRARHCPALFIVLDNLPARIDRSAIVGLLANPLSPDRELTPGSPRPAARSATSPRACAPG
jgi:hypothetical protein